MTILKLLRNGLKFSDGVEKHCWKRNCFLEAIVPYSHFFPLQTFLLQGHLTLSHTTNFRLFQTERVYRGQFQIDENGRELSKKLENTMGKGDIACNKQFLLFSHCIQNICTADT